MRGGVEQVVAAAPHRACAGGQESSDFIFIKPRHIALVAEVEAQVDAANREVETISVGEALGLFAGSGHHAI